jgi:molecular chaperone DnaJ
VAGHKRDYYEVLGVRRDADDAEIKQAFRELARQHHPDVNPDNDRAEERFKEANEAYAVLSDPKARARYDRWGHAGIGQDGGAGGGQGGAVSSVVDAFDELVGDFLRRRRQKKRGRDLRYTLEVSFEEAAFGCTKTIQVPVSSSDGDGDRTRAFEISLPPGTKPGAIKRLRGEGEPGRAGGGPGDLHVIVRVADHPVFSRDGFDVTCEVPVSFAQAALGAVVDVPTLDGKVRMRIPEGTQSGRTFRLRGKGVPRGASKNALRGDQLVRIAVETPTGLTARQRELLEAFANESGDAIAHPQKQGFLDKLKALFQD